jgi:ATP-dependent RNA helicase RhlE
VRFQDFELSQALQSALRRTGYREPTPIQQAAIPPALSGKDVLGCAQTGTGKTAAFALPILQRIDQLSSDAPVLRALILTPTRELAAQIGDSLSTYGADLDLYHSVVFGGVSQRSQVQELKRGVDILVATPGRLLDLMQQGVVDLSRVRIFVLDEADRMLDMGFIHDVRRITAKLPAERQTLFFSATMPAEIRKLADALLVDPVFVSVTPIASTAENVAQSVYFVTREQKLPLLVSKLREPGFSRVLVFCRTKHGANRVAQQLERAKIPSGAIHGNKSQASRTHVLESFKSGKLRVLVATDIAARGIDVEGVTHVINYEIPNVPETYVHRIGRTARAGRAGQAISFCDDEERYYLEDIEKLIQLHVPRATDAAHASELPPPPATDLVSKRFHSKKPQIQQRGAGRAGDGRPQRQPRSVGAHPRATGAHEAARPNKHASGQRPAQRPATAGAAQARGSSHSGARPQATPGAAQARGSSHPGARPHRPGAHPPKRGERRGVPRRKSKG